MKFKIINSKKGSLFITVETIVIIIIAFVVLGLGVNFVQGQFQNIEEGATSIHEQSSQQLLEDLRRVDAKLAFPTNELTLQIKEEDVQIIGLKNTLDLSKYFRVKIMYQVNDGSFVDFKGNGLQIIKEDNNAEAGMYFDNSWQKIEANEHKIVPFSLTAPDKQGTYIYKILIEVADDDLGINLEEYDSKTFFMNIK